MKKFALAAALVAAAVVSAPEESKADFEVCNQTWDTVAVSFGYKEDGVWVSEGWWNLDYGDCATVYAGELTEYNYFVRGEGDSLMWEDDYTFCTDPQAYTIYGDTNCYERGYDLEGFMLIDVGNYRDYTLDLVE